MTLLVSVALTVTSNEREQELEAEALRVRQLLMLASENAVLESRELGVFLSAEGYQFARLEADNAPTRRLKERQWAIITDNDLLKERKWPKELQVKVLTDDEYVQPDLASDDGRETPETPAIWVFSTGELSPFALHLSYPTIPLVFIIKGDENGVAELIQEERDGDDT